MNSTRTTSRTSSARTAWGQDLQFSYVVFMQFELGKGVQAMCAFAEAPSDHLMNLITTLKLTMAIKPHTIAPVSKVSIIDMMTSSNDMFEKAMKNFPTTNRVTAQPSHVALGSEITIVCDGFSSLAAAGGIGKEMAFLDINAAMARGMFGRDPIPTWRDKECLAELHCRGDELRHGRLGRPGSLPVDLVTN